VSFLVAFAAGCKYGIPGKLAFVKTEDEEFFLQRKKGRSSRLALPGVGVEKVTSISRMRFSRSMLEESIRPCSV